MSTQLVSYWPFTNIVQQCKVSNTECVDIVVTILLISISTPSTVYVVFFSGFIWGINSFDQFGVELGKHMAKNVRAQLSASRKTGASVQGFNSSTISLLEAYLAHGKIMKQQQQPNYYDD